ncbi:glycosyltransferase [Marisediminicola senii]|uniref:glycosyltransferase n=1 Tax=Marisediminicola senii TaxID=2711233 RepID=UPI0013EE23D5|nr:glycosyltransferase [Marisediminicola senii]
MNQPDQHKREQVEYLVGGFRISVQDDSTTPGPRTHIVGFVGGLRAKNTNVNVLVASTFPGMGRFARIRQTDYGSSSRPRILAADIIRIMAAGWSGANVLVRTWTDRRSTDIIYERVAVFQSLSSFHAAKSRAFRVVEANGILSRETARDRKVLVLEGLAAALERRALRRASLVVSVSEALKRELVAFAGLTPSQILVLPNAASLSTTELPVSPDEDSPVVGFVGSVVEWHRLDKLIDSFARTDGVRLEVIGEGPELERLQRISVGLGIAGRVSFLGRLPHDKALERMSHWSVGFAGHEKSSSTVMYHSPLKLYEYAALGMHILCSPSDDAVSLAESASVHIYDTERDGSLMEALLSSITAARSDSHEARVVRRQHVAANHSWEARAGLFLDTVQLHRVSYKKTEVRDV